MHLALRNPSPVAASPRYDRRPAAYSPRSGAVNGRGRRPGRNGGVWSPSSPMALLEDRTMKPRFRFARAHLILASLCLALGPIDAAAMASGPEPAPGASDLLPGAEEGFVDSGGVKIHYVGLGKRDGPLVVMIHGFPDFWYSWRVQMPALAKRFHVVAIDQRGYNLSGQPEGVDNYKTEKLVGDLLAIVDHFNREKAIIVGHDWGGLVAWSFAMAHPDRIDRLIVLNLPHPRGLLRELQTNPQQQKNSQYARD